MTRQAAITSTARRVTAAGRRAARLRPGPPGTLLLAMYASVGAIARLAIPAVWNQAILGITARDQHSIDFLQYVLIAARPNLLALARSNTQPNLNAEQVANLAFRIPDARQQCLVAERLDAMWSGVASAIDVLQSTEARTDSLYVAAARELILTPSVPSAPIKLVARPGTGHTPSRSVAEFWNPEECTIPWFGLADVWQIRDDARDVVVETAEKISPLGLANSAAVLHPAGTIIFSRTASVGFVGQMGVDMAVTQDFMTWTCGPRLLGAYLMHALRAMRPEILQRVQGSTHKTIYMPDLMGLKIPLPDPARQREIVDRLDQVLAALRRVKPTRERVRDALIEYRDALTHEAVTGKLDLMQVSERHMEERLYAAAEGRRDEVPV